MGASVITFFDAVRSIGIDHHRKTLSVLDQLVDQDLAVLIVTVVIARAVDNQ